MFYDLSDVANPRDIGFFGLGLSLCVERKQKEKNETEFALDVLIYLFVR